MAVPWTLLSSPLPVSPPKQSLTFCELPPRLVGASLRTLSKFANRLSNFPTNLSILLWTSPSLLWQEGTKPGLVSPWCSFLFPLTQSLLKTPRLNFPTLPDIL